MPELPEVETAMRGVEPALLGHRLTRVTARRAGLRWPLPSDLSQRLEGATVIAVRRRAKYGLVDTDRGDTLILHLGMSGSLRLDPVETRPHDHVLIEGEGGRVHLHDPRRFGSLHLQRTDALDSCAPLAGIGPEPLTRAFDAEHLSRCLAGRRASISSLLLNQRIGAGLGNIYVAESLYRARISPFRPGGEVAPREVAALVGEIKQVLREAIVAGGSSLSDFSQPNGQLGYFKAAHRVYDREGQPCIGCAELVRRTKVGSRSSFHCPKCQR